MESKRVTLADRWKYMGRRFIETTKNDYEVLVETNTKYQIFVNEYCTMFVDKSDCYVLESLKDYMAREYK